MADVGVCPAGRAAFAGGAAVSRTRWLDPWPPLPPGGWLRSPVDELPFPCRPQDGALLFALARHAMWHGLHALALPNGGEVLMPAYHHGSEVEAVCRSGLRPVFYGGTVDLVPDEEELDGMITSRTCALHIVHYLGFPQDAARWRRFCDERGLTLIEDAAQAWLAEREGVPVGSHGDLAFVCLYKTFGLPDGAAVLCRTPLTRAATRATAGRGIGKVLDLHASWAAQRVPLHRPAKPRPYDPAADFALGVPNSRPATASRALLRRVVDTGAAAARRKHYRLVLTAAGAHVPRPFAVLPQGASPWVLPLEVDDKPGARQRLARAGIGTLDMWSVPHPALEAGRFPAIAARRSRTVGLPVHQELRRQDVERAAEAVAELLAGES